MSEEKGKAHWITLKSGTRCLVDAEGNILKGPNELKNRNLHELKPEDGVSVLVDTSPNSKDYNRILKSHNGDYYKAASEFFKKYLQNKVMKGRIGDGDGYIAFTGAGFSKMRFGLKQDPVKAALIPHVPEIIESGHYFIDPLNKKRSDNKTRFHSYSKTISTAEGDRNVIVDVAEMKDEAPTFSAYGITREGLKNYEKRKEKTRESKGANPNASRVIDSSAQDESLSEILPSYYEVVNIRINEQEPEPKMKRQEKETYLAMDSAPSARRKDENGFLHVEKSNLTKEQVVPYLGFCIPDWEKHGLDPAKEYYGYRPAEEIEKAADTFNGLPLMLLHHEISAENPKKEYQVGTLGTNAKWEAPYLTNSLVITDSAGIMAVENDLCRDISLAYFYDPDFTPGVFNGVPYDFVIRNIRGNHGALVEKGRAGKDVIVADSADLSTKRGEKSLMSKLINFFRGAMDSDPEIAKEALAVARESLAKPQVEEKVEIAEDEDKQAKINEIVKSFDGLLSEEEEKKLRDTLADLAYSKATGESKIAQKVDGEDSLNTAEAYAYGEKKEREREEREEMKGGMDDDRLDIAEAVSAGEKHERDRLMREHMKKAEDAMKACGMDDADDAIKAAFARGFAYGMHDGEKDMRNPDERSKLDREHEREGLEKAIEKRVEQKLHDKFAAADEVEPAVGRVKVCAFDSADGIYAYALRQMGKNVPLKSAKEVFRAIVETHGRKIAMDSAIPETGSYGGIFSGLNNIKVER
ncbi:MAG: DUF2213 domain-containing protein [Oxalobacter formigenes]|nr:DUF2213 domain-containing protein [Oxalobacter formigenes]